MRAAAVLGGLWLLLTALFVAGDIYGQFHNLSWCRDRGGAGAQALGSGARWKGWTPPTATCTYALRERVVVVERHPDYLGAVASAGALPGLMLLGAGVARLIARPTRRLSPF